MGECTNLLDRTTVLYEDLVWVFTQRTLFGDWDLAKNNAFR